MNEDELKAEAKQVEQTLEQGAEKLALKSKDELLAAAQKTFGPGIAQARKVPRWRWWALGILAALLIALSLFLARPAHAQTTVTKTILADAVTTYDDGTPLPAGTVVTYDLEHKYCGDAAWVVYAAALSSPSSVRQLNPVCHQYAFVAIANGQRSLESMALTIDLTPPKTPAAPMNVRAQ